MAGGEFDSPRSRSPLGGRSGWSFWVVVLGGRSGWSLWVVVLGGRCGWSLMAPGWHARHARSTLAVSVI